MNTHDFEPIREILYRMNARYLTVRPQGFETTRDKSLQESIRTRIYGFGNARTFYRGRKPFCRSLDGLMALGKSEKRCQTCPDRKNCTPQVRVDLLVEQDPYRLLLSYTSARNFLRYIADFEEGHKRLETTYTTIQVVNRGRWGELRFSRSSKHPKQNQ